VESDRLFEGKKAWPVLTAEELADVEVRAMTPLDLPPDIARLVYSVKALRAAAEKAHDALHEADRLLYLLRMEDIGLRPNVTHVDAVARIVVRAHETLHRAGVSADAHADGERAPEACDSADAFLGEISAMRAQLVEAGGPFDVEAMLKANE
jgi:hypothetical protein